MKNERGSITLFVLVAMIFLLTIAFTAYAAAMVKLQAQNAEIERIKASYEQNLNAESLKTLYENLTAPETKGKASRYTCIDGVFCNSPELIGFNLTKTYYVTYDSSGNETISALPVAEQDAPPDWYNYRDKKWANIVTINNGNKTYWVWIPRFVYKTPAEDSSLPAKTTDVKFVGIDENGHDYCKIYQNGSETDVDISSYKTSNAFEFNGEHRKGYWVSKYRIQEGDHSTADASTTNIEVDVSGFNPSTTKYVTYDDSGNETIGANIQLDSNGNATNKPSNWYDYKNKKWANIVTENNGNKAYWTYIPRYEYQNILWKYLKPEIKFIKTSDVVESGYKISEAFKFNGQELKGYWVSKYRVQEDNSSTTSIANIEVDVSGFNPSVTKFVTYDSEGNETVGSNIQIASDGTASNKPSNWYDYKNKKWANLVTENNGLKSYWTYIPRYQYKITDWKYLAPDVWFLKTTDSVMSGYKISNAFTFNGQALRGYWASKYRIQDNTNNTEFNGTYYQRSN